MRKSLNQVQNVDEINFCGVTDNLPLSNINDDTISNLNADNTIHSLQRSNKKYMVQINLDDNICSMELDTGAAISSMSIKEFRKLFSTKEIINTNLSLKTYTGK